ncbi:hypothetical protein EIP91_003836 [Steccherinum ochraceum]|uniref:DUF6534 domain-containing protein n=1 Tax=Steccherinum ochraceum TaxID=92696 RepID=A0A4R0RQF4_9APHY|nr:hypothetical protein EIP91_003836 [Steccherinum ochraceum]
MAASIVESRLGALVVEGCITLMLYGVLTVQAYVFMLSSQKDSMFMKLSAASVWLLESLVSAFMIHALYHYTITLFGHPTEIEMVVWSAPSLYTADRVAVTMVQGHVNVSSSPNSCLTFIQLLHLSHLADEREISFLRYPRSSLGLTYRSVLFPYPISVAILAYIWKLKTWTKIHSDGITRKIVTSCLSVGLATDVVVTAYMIYFLQRDKVGFRGYAFAFTQRVDEAKTTVRTDHAIRKMITSIVNSGTAVVASSVALLATYLSSKQSLAFIGFITISSVSYGNMYFGILNASRALRKNAAIVSASGGQELSTFNQHRMRQPIEILSVQETETTPGNVPMGILKTTQLHDDSEGSFDAEKAKEASLAHKTSDLSEVVS